MIQTTSSRETRIFCRARLLQKGAKLIALNEFYPKGLSQNKCIDISSKLIHQLMVDIDAVKRRFESLLPAVDERMRRLIAAAESLAIDYGGISIVSHTYSMTDPNVPILSLACGDIPNSLLPHAL
jgi:hypothetical protein